MTTFWVDGAGGSNSNLGTQQSPFKDIYKPWGVCAPGDTINLLNTVIYPYMYLSGKSGLPGAPITIRGVGTTYSMTKVNGGGTGSSFMLDGANYINLSNFDCTAPKAFHGIFVKNAHHVNITENVAHHCGGSGIQYESCDWITATGNVVYDNANDTSNNIYCSGISTHENLQIDNDATSYKVIIRNNKIYNNINILHPGVSSNSDGSGIIIDDNRNLQTPGRPPYVGKTLINNNRIYNNGGRGISLFQSNNCDVIANRCSRNNQDPFEGFWTPGEIGVITCANINILHNELWSDGVGAGPLIGNHVPVSVQGCDGPVTVDFNIWHNAQNDPTLAFYKQTNTGLITVGNGNMWQMPSFMKEQAGR